MAEGTSGTSAFPIHLLESLAEMSMTDTSMSRHSDHVSSPEHDTVECNEATAERKIDSQADTKGPETPADAPLYPGALEQSILVIALMLAMFIVALDLVGRKHLAFILLTVSS
jgi:hypothetical protein